MRRKLSMGSKLEFFARNMLIFMNLQRLTIESRQRRFILADTNGFAELSPPGSQSRWRGELREPVYHRASTVPTIKEKLVI